MDKALTEEDKKKIYDILADQFISGLQKTYIGIEEQRQIAREVLNGISNAKTMSDAILFLQSISKKHSFFQPAIILLSGDATKQKEAEIVNKLQHYIKNN